MISRITICRLGISVLCARITARRTPGHNTENGRESFQEALVAPIIIPPSAAQNNVPRKLKMIVRSAVKPATRLQALTYFNAVLAGWKLITDWFRGLS